MSESKLKQNIINDIILKEMSNFNEENQIDLSKVKIISECAERQLFSQQDVSIVLTIDREDGLSIEDGDQPIEVIAVFDGHGPNLVIDIIQELNLPHHFEKVKPVESIQQAIDEQIAIKQKKIAEIPYISGTNYKKYVQSKIKDTDILCSGSTCAFAKIYRNTITKQVKIVAEWLGDSQIVAIINGEIVFISEIHHSSSESEIKRLRDNNVQFILEKSNQGFKVVSSDRIVSDPGKYIVFKNRYQLASTRSLGHGRLLGTETQKHVIECTTNDDVKILVFSDGVGDMLNIETDKQILIDLSAKELVEFAERRWKQEWNYGRIKTLFPANGYDDCCCAMWWQKKVDNSS